MNYYLYKINQILPLITGKDLSQIFDELSTGMAKNNSEIWQLSQTEQGILAAVLGSMLHDAYCQGRKLSPERRAELNIPEIFANEPRLKVLNKALDAEFVQKVISGEIPQSHTLKVNKDGSVVMDIANTEFVNLSPYWQKENFNAGEASVRLVVSNWDALRSDNSDVRLSVAYAISAAIHEAWLARENVYLDEEKLPDGSVKVYTNSELDTAFNQLSAPEQDKDSIQFDMALKLINDLDELAKKKRKTFGGNVPTNE